MIVEPIVNITLACLTIAVILLICFVRAGKTSDEACTIIEDLKKRLEESEGFYRRSQTRLAIAIAGTGKSELALAQLITRCAEVAEAMKAEREGRRRTVSGLIKLYYNRCDDGVMRRLTGLGVPDALVKSVRQQKQARASERVREKTKGHPEATATLDKFLAEFGGAKEEPEAEPEPITADETETVLKAVREHGEPKKKVCPTCEGRNKCPHYDVGVWSTCTAEGTSTGPCVNHDKWPELCNAPCPDCHPESEAP